MKQKVISFTTAPRVKSDLDNDLKEYFEDGWIIQTVNTTFVDTAGATAILYTFLLQKDK